MSLVWNEPCLVGALREVSAACTLTWILGIFLINTLLAIVLIFDGLWVNIYGLSGLVYLLLPNLGMGVYLGTFGNI